MPLLWTLRGINVGIRALATHHLDFLGEREERIVCARRNKLARSPLRPKTTRIIVECDADSNRLNTTIYTRVSHYDDIDSLQSAMMTFHVGNRRPSSASKKLNEREDENFKRELSDRDVLFESLMNYRSQSAESLQRR